MNLLDDAPLGPDPVTHAFVIGVGDYPHSAPAWGGVPSLGQVPNLPSAADSAKMVCDWLLSTKLAAPLASLEVVISDPQQGAPRYPWRPGKVIESATSQNVFKAGKAWLDRLRLRRGDVAFFYCCGHGAAHASSPVLFLEDLNQTEENPWTHLNVGDLAQALRRLNTIKCAFMFSDACGEFIPLLEFSSPTSTRFYPAPLPFAEARDKVFLLCAAPSALLAYEGEHLDPQGQIVARAGRFTQVLLRALNGLSARWEDARWAITPMNVMFDLKKLRRLYYSHWDERPFEPSPALTQSDSFPILHPTAPMLPLVITTDPQEIAGSLDLHISERNEPQPPWLYSKQERSSTAWRTEIPATLAPRYAVALAPELNPPPFHSSLFIPTAPLFDHQIPVGAP